MVYLLRFFSVVARWFFTGRHVLRIDHSADRLGSIGLGHTEGSTRRLILWWQMVTLLGCNEHLGRHHYHVFRGHCHELHCFLFTVFSNSPVAFPRPRLHFRGSSRRSNGNPVDSPTDPRQSLVERGQTAQIQMNQVPLSSRRAGHFAFSKPASPVW